MIKLCLFLLLLVCVSCQPGDHPSVNSLGTLLEDIEWLVHLGEHDLAKEKLLQLPATIQSPQNVEDSIANACLALLRAQLNGQREETGPIVEKLESILHQELSLPSLQKTRIYITLASFYCLASDTIFQVDPYLKSAIALLQAELMDIFHSRNPYNPRVLAIYSLKRKIRSLILRRGEINMKLENWTEALACFEEYCNHEEESRLQKLEQRKKQIEPFLSYQPNGKNVYLWEWEHIHTEMLELKKTHAYKEVCREMLK